MSWSTAFEKTQKAEYWGFVDLSENFTRDTTLRYKDYNVFFNLFKLLIEFGKFFYSRMIGPFINQTFPGGNINIYLDASS